MRGSEARSSPLSKMASLLSSPRVWTSSFPLPGFIRPYWLSNIACPGWEGATLRYVIGSTYKQQPALNSGDGPRGGRRGRASWTVARSPARNATLRALMRALFCRCVLLLTECGGFAALQGHCGVGKTVVCCSVKTL